LTGETIASGAHLEGTTRDAVSNILVDYVIRSSRAVGTPGADDPARVRQDALDAVGAIAGAAARREVEKVIDGL
jgi:hypothetical protein